MQLGGEPALAGPGEADELEHAALAPREPVGGCGQDTDLDLPPDERRRLLRGDPVGVARGAGRHDRCLHRAALALDREGRHRMRRDVPTSTGSRQRGSRREQRSGSGLPGHPGGQVHRVAHRAVRPARRAADSAAVDRPLVDAHPQGQCARLLQGLHTEAEHRLRVSFVRVGRTGGQHELATVRADVGADDGHAVALGEVDDAHDEPLQLGVQHLETVFAQQVVATAELQETHGRDPVLTVGGHPGEPAAQRVGNVVT